MTVPGELVSGVAQILDLRGRPAGTGFLVTDTLLVTCAHVLMAAGGAADRATSADAAAAGPVLVRFVHLDDTPRRAWAEAESWRSPESGDVAFLRVTDPVPAMARPLPLGPAGGASRHPVKTFGFPVNAPGGGHYGYGLAGDLIQGDHGATLLQLLDCTEVTEGFSGGPVLDEQTGLVIGMVDSVTAPDRLGRGRSTAYVTPTETLRTIHPDLSFSEVCPYPGLRAFTTTDAAWFHGRDRAIRAVLASLRRSPSFLALLGPSGSGKSSLVQAGVRPALARAELPGSDRWGWLVTRPGEDPYAQLAQAGLTGAGTADAETGSTIVETGLTIAVRRWLAEHEEAGRLVLVFDQFEELLVATPPQYRVRLLEQLVDLPEQEPAATVMITLRDDFYSRLAATAPALMVQVERGLVNVPAMLERGDLADIIQRPALAVGLTLEPNLAERIGRDAAQMSVPASLAGTAPVTVLPLLSSALAELWRRREDGRLTHRAYDQIGGVVGWLDRWCDQAYRDTCQALPPPAQPLVRRVVTALVRPGDEATNVPPTRQRRTLDQLRTAAPEPDQDMATIVVGALADWRLVTTGRDPDTGGPVVELAHEALIHEWGALRRWLADDHAFLSWRRDLEAGHLRWRTSTGSAARRALFGGLARAAGRTRRTESATRVGPDPELLLRGSALEGAREWLARRSGELPPDLVEFVRLSEVAESQRLTRDRRRVLVLACLLVLAVVLGSLAGLQSNLASRRAAEAQEQTQQADSRRLATLAISEAGRRPDLSLLLALESLRTAPSREAWGSLGTLLSRPAATARVLYGHTDQVTGAAFGPDGTLVTTDFDGSVRMWDSAGQPVGVLDGPAADQDIAVSPDGRWLATSDLFGGVWRWDATARRPVGSQLADKVGLLGGVEFSPDSTLLAGIVGGDVLLWNAATGEPFGAPIKPRSGNLADIAFSPDGAILTTVSDVGIIQLWDVATRSKKSAFPIDLGASTVAFSPDGTQLAVGGEAGVVHLVTPGRQPASELLATTGRVAALAYRPDGTAIVIADSEGVVQEWSLTSLQKIGPPLLGHASRVGSMVFSPDGRRLATGGADATVRLWDLTVRQPLGASLLGHLRSVNALAFSPDGQTLATGGFDRITRLWNVATRQPTGPELNPYHPQELNPNIPLSDDSITAVMFTASDRLVVTSLGAVRQWDTGTPTPIAVLAEKTRSTAVSPDRRWIALAYEDKTVHLFDVATRQEVGVPFTLPAGASAMAFSPDSTRLAAAVGVSVVRVWDVATRTQVAEGRSERPEPTGTVAFSPDGTTLATAGRFSKDVRLWRLSGSELRRELLGYDASVNAVTFSPDGTLLATASDDQTVRLWEVATRQPFGDPLTGHTNGVKGIAFSPDGDLLASASDDGSARLWAMPRTWVRHACELAGRNLSQAEWHRYAPSGRPYVRGCDQFPSGYGAPPEAPVAAYPR